MRRVLIVITGFALIAAACANGGGVPLDDAALPEVEASTPADDAADASAADQPAEEPGEASLTASDDSIVDELPDATDRAEDEIVSPESTLPKPTPSLPPAETIPPSDPPPAVTGEVPMDLLEAIMADAESRMTTKGALTVVRAESVTWSDGSLGCPEPGVMYTQALVDGYWVVLDAGGSQMDYRASSRGSFKLCESSLGVPPPSDDSK
ncbi:MAG: hypothetical protein P1T08_16025 [Acidimicrobiia bacterium]|nr:hypothetical protein [Acidimicrobiia bacterium]